MAVRKFPLATGETYHIFNRSIARQPIFLTQKHYQRMTDVISYYLFVKPPIRFSYYNRLQHEQKEIILTTLATKHKKQVEFYAYCLMPNHFHFLLKQTEPNGISRFVSTVQNSYARYFNTKQNRTGAVFQEMFKTVHLETDEQMLHVLRYILLNPHTSFVLKNLTDLENYTWSAFPDYLQKRKSFVNIEYLTNFFPSNDALKTFILDQADYQRQLHKIQHLTLK